MIIAAFVYGLATPVSALRFFYLLCALLGTFGVFTKYIWLPLGCVTALDILLQYSFQCLLATHFFPLEGCDGPTPSPACDALCPLAQVGRYLELRAQAH